MRRGRNVYGVLAVMTAALLLAPGALGATNKEIASDLADGRLDGTYSQAELSAFINSATTQGYDNPVTNPPAQVCVEVAPGTPGAVQGRDGKWYTGPGAANCGTPPVAQQVCVEVAPGTPGAVQGRDGKWYTGPNAHLCGSPLPPANTPVGGVAGEQIVTLAPVAGVAGAQKTKKAPKAAPAKAQVAGVQTTRRTGSLPFTGMDVALLVFGGLLLLGVGAGMRTLARQRI